MNNLEFRKIKSNEDNLRFRKISQNEEEESHFKEYVEWLIENKLPLPFNWYYGITDKYDIIPIAIETQLEEDRIEFTTEGIHIFYVHGDLITHGSGKNKQIGKKIDSWTYRPDFRVYFINPITNKKDWFTIETKGQVMVYSANGRFGSNIQEKAKLIDKMVREQIRNGIINWKYMKLRLYRHKEGHRWIDWFEWNEYDKENRRNRKKSKINE